MATKIPGETYRGEAVTLPLSEDGQVTAYVWPCRILNIQGVGQGGPTIGVDVGNEEAIRYDCHDAVGHWHKGGYDKLKAGGSHVEFPEGLVDIASQVPWCLAQIRDEGQQLLGEAGYPDEAASLDGEMIGAATEAIMAHLEKEGDLRSKAIEQGLIAD